MGLFEFRFPDIGEGIQEGTVVKWLVNEGDEVKSDQVIAEVETDKAVAEIPSPKNGKVLKIHVGEGDIIKVGQVLVTLEVAGAGNKEKSSSENKPERSQKEEEAVSEKAGGVVGFIPQSEEDLGISSKSVKNMKSINRPVNSQEGVKATPFVRKFAKEMGIDISKIKGTGYYGQATVKDIKSAVGAVEKDGPEKVEVAINQDKQNKAKVIKKYDLWGYVDHIPLRGIRKSIAEHMEKSWQAPLVTHTDEADITGLFRLREEEKKKAEKKGVNLTYLPYIIKAVIKALKKHPMLNASIDKENNDIIVKKYYNISIAVDTEDGLLVPVVKGADEKDLYALAKEIVDLAEKAKSKKLDLADMKGGSFTITNIGVFGGIFFTPLLNSPESAILGIGRIGDKAIVADGKIAIRKIMPLSLSFDHRVVDGAEAARFVTDLITIFGSPKDIM